MGPSCRPGRPGLKLLDRHQSTHLDFTLKYTPLKEPAQGGEFFRRPAVSMLTTTDNPGRKRSLSI